MEEQIGAMFWRKSCQSEVPLKFVSGVLNIKRSTPVKREHSLDQGSSNLSLEGQSAAEFSSNPDQTHLPVIF